MISFIQRIVDLIDRRPWRLVLERHDSTFILTSFKGRRHIRLSTLVERYQPASVLGVFLPLDGHKSTVPFQHLAVVRQALLELECESLQVQISADAKAFHVEEVPACFRMRYVWSKSAGCIQRELTKDAEYCGDGWFLCGDSAWCMRSHVPTDDVWLWKSTIGDQDIVEFLQDTLPRWQGKDWPVVCDLGYSEESVVALAVRYVCDDYLDCGITWNVADSAIQGIPSLPDHVLADSIVRPGVSPQSLAGHVPRDSQAFRIAAQEIPAFLHDDWPRIERWSSGAVAALKEQHRILTGPGTLKLVVAPKDRRGMSVALATPIFCCDGIVQPAETVSRQLNAQTEFIRLPGAWVPAKTVHQSGIGPLGRLTDGTPLAPIELDALEVLKRGSERLAGPWTRIDFPGLMLPQGESATDTAHLHLEFLHRWRIPGGLIGDLVTYQDAFLNLMAHIVRREPGLKVLVIGTRKTLDLLDPAWLSIASARFNGNRNDPPFTRTPSSLVLATKKAIEVVPELTKPRWDLVCILGADSLIKSQRSKSYRHASRCSRSLTIGLFSGRDFMKRTQAHEALSHVFRIPKGESGAILWKYGLCDPKQRPFTLPPAYKMPVKKPRSLTGVNPAEVVIGSGHHTSGAVPIPVRPRTTSVPRQSSQRIPTSRYSGAYVEVHYSDGRELFVREARNVVNKRESRARFVPFQCYWPTYSSMTREQQRWYFYWRAQVRAGRYPDTDLSYIFVHVYELINHVGVQNARDGYERLRQLWRNYRDRFPKLDRYLIDWIADYAIINKVAEDHLEIYKEALAIDAKVGSLNLILPACLDQGLSQLPISIIDGLCTYKLQRSRFYTGGYQSKVEESLPAVIEAVDDYMRQRFGSGIFDLFNPGAPAPVRRQAFQSARYAGQVRTITLGNVVPLSEHEPLRDFMTALVKHTENILRQRAGFRGRLRGYTLEPEILAVIEKHLGIEQVVHDVPLPPARVQIDLERVQALTSESDRVREMLSSDGEGNDEIVGSKCYGSSLESEVSLKQSRAPQERLVDLSSVRTILSRLSVSERGVLVTLLAAGGQLSTVALGQAMPDILLEATIDAINNVALANLGDILIAEEEGIQVLTDDYCNELAHLLQAPQSDVMPESDSETSSLPEEWQDLRDQLADHQLAVLEALVGQKDSSTMVRQIADANATMPGALLDSINQIAIDTIGDIILDATVDPPIIEDEDMHMVQTVLAEAASS